MRLIILRMIAAGSLSAFSTVVSTAPSLRPQPARPAPQPREQTRASFAQTSLTPVMADAPARSLPRGSKLDIVV